MYEIDFLPVGDEGQSGDAIAVRFSTAADPTYRTVIIDAGFQDDGTALVEHVDTWYGDRHIDLAIVTHPDGDHIGGMGTVLEELEVGTLCIHNIGDRGGASLPAADAVNELIKIAEREGTNVHEPFTGDSAFNGALRFLGPDEQWYEDLVKEQLAEAPARALRKARTPVRDALRAAGQRFLTYLPREVPFDDQGGTNPRNNTSVVTLLEIDGDRLLFTGDAGVPALERAWNWLTSVTSDSTPPSFMQIPHAGSRHNGSSDLLNLILGRQGQDASRTAYVSVASKAKRHPSPRVVNAYMRRGCRVYETRGGTKWHHSGNVPARGWSRATPLEPMDESGED